MEVVENPVQFIRDERINPFDRSAWKAYGTASYNEYFLYRFFDAEDRLLYVGITWNPYARWVVHARSKKWWGAVCRFDLYNCGDEHTARRWETWCIRNLDPKHNKHQNLRWHRGTD